MSDLTVVIASTAHPPGDQRIEQWQRSFEADGWSVDIWCSEAVGRAQRATHAARTLIRAARADYRAMVLVDPELIAAAPLVLAASDDIIVVADVHEDFSTVATDHSGWEGQLLKRGGQAAGFAVQAAAARAHVTVVADTHLPPYETRHRFVGRNLPDPAQFPPRPISAAGRRAVYAGDLTHQRGLTHMLDAVVLTPPWQLHLYGPPRPQALVEIADAARRSEGRIRWMGQLPHSELVQRLPDYDVGLSILDPIPSYVAAFPSKIAEYQAAGLAIVTSDLPRVTTSVRQHNCGIVLDGLGSPASHGEQLRSVLRRLDETDELLVMRKAARAAFEALDLKESLRDAATLVAQGCRNNAFL